MIVELGPRPRARLIELARALDREGRGVALLDGDGWGGVELAVDPADEVRVPLGRDALARVASLLDALSSPSAPRASGWAGRPAASRWIGYVAYEAARALERPSWTRGGGKDDRPPPIGEALVLRRFGAVARRDEATGIVAVEGDDAADVARLAREIDRPIPALAPPQPLALAPADPDSAHRARIVRALELVARGDLYQVNLARTFEGRSASTATELLASLRARASARYAAAIDFGDHVVASTSPELFLELDPPRAGRARRVRTSPIKGSRPRGRDAREDLALREELDRDPKERAELVMVVDLERNDLGRLATIGSVRVCGEPRIETSRTVHHRVHDVVARLPLGVDLGAVFAATFPSGSVTGAPKVRAMEVIAELERSRRGVYCGAILSIGRDGGARASMAIRTAVAEGGRVVYAAGGGIVEASDPDREVDETRWKARQVIAG